MTSDELQYEDLENENTLLPIARFTQLIKNNKLASSILFIGSLFIVIGIIFSLGNIKKDSQDIQIIEDTSTSSQKLVVEVSGAVNNPGVYEFSNDERVEDALVKAGGLTEDADKNWMDKVLNRAAKLTDGQKIYIPKTDEPFDNAQGKQSEVLSANNLGGDQNVSSGNYAEIGELVNINTATANQLETLWGIGQVTAQNIIDQRPYSSVEELLSKKIIKTNVYDRNKDLLTVY